MQTEKVGLLKRVCTSHCVSPGKNFHLRHFERCYKELMPLVIDDNVSYFLRKKKNKKNSHKYFFVALNVSVNVFFYVSLVIVSILARSFSLTITHYAAAMPYLSLFSLSSFSHILNDSLHEKNAYIRDFIR